MILSGYRESHLSNKEYYRQQGRLKGLQKPIKNVINTYWLLMDKLY